MQFRQKTDEVLLAGLQKPSPELYRSWISSRIRSSAVRVLMSGPHPTSQRCHVKIFDFAMAVPAKPGPASLKACRLARPPSPKGKAFCSLTTRDLLGCSASFPVTPASPREWGSTLRQEGNFAFGKVIPAPWAGMARLESKIRGAPPRRGIGHPCPCCAYIVPHPSANRNEVPFRPASRATSPFTWGGLGRL